MDPARCHRVRSFEARLGAARRWTGRVAAIAVIIVAAASGAILADLSDRSSVPDLDSFLHSELPSTGAIYDQQGELLLEVARERRSLVAFDEIPDVVREAVISVEDRNFFAHRGVDPSAWPRVVLRNLRAVLADGYRALLRDGSLQVTFRQGGSTITQQLVRSSFLADLTRRENDPVLLRQTPVAQLLAMGIGVPATNKLWRKLEEMRLSLWLESALEKRLGSRQKAKQLIFARYANTIYLGNGRYGLAAASSYYFGVPLGRLTAAGEAALLAAAIKNPRDYAPSSPNAERVLRQRNAALALMHGSGYLSAAALQRWQHEPLPQPLWLAENEDSGAAVASVFDELRDGVAGFGVDDLTLGRIRVHSTLDARIQRITEDAVEEGLRRYEKRHPQFQGQTQAAVVVLKNANAAVLAEVGGRRLFNGVERRQGDFNRATQALRQPGSAFKPFVYLAALRQGATLDTTVSDEPLEISTSNRAVKAIANYDLTFKGPIPLRQALAESRNAAAVWTAREVGLEPIRQIAAELGIHTPLQPYLSAALGSSEVILVELANAYRAMASGLAAAPHVIDRLEDAQGQTLFVAPDVRRRHDLPRLRLMQEALRGAVRLPTGTAHALQGRGFPIQVMGKTGTTSDFRDAVFVGSTYGVDGITVAVWIGHDDQRPLGNGETGARTALPIFREVMLHLYGAQAPLGASPPVPGEIERSIDAYLAGADGDADGASLLRVAVEWPGATELSPAPPDLEREDRPGWRCYADLGGSACMRIASAVLDQ